jgi:hypothetical protein
MKSTLRAEVDLSRDCALGIMDFGYTPYALGDTMTWLTNLQIVAHVNNVSSVEIAILTRPERPSSRLQRAINAYSYIHALESLYPAFLCCPMLRSIRIYERYKPFAQRILAAVLARSATWPHLISHFREELDYSSHRQINSFYRQKKYIPTLGPPRGYEIEAGRFRERFLAGRQPIVVNIRRRALSFDPAALQRDSVASAWDRFFAQAEDLYPTATFVVVGGFSEWERDLVRRPNVVVPRALGYGLGLELSLLLGGIPFMGTSSGFSAAATFSKVPYVITNFEHQSSAYIDLPIGTERYPFAAPSQRLNWEPETEDILLAEFARLWGEAIAPREQVAAP